MTAMFFLKRLEEEFTSKVFATGNPGLDVCLKRLHVNFPSLRLQQFASKSYVVVSFCGKWLGDEYLVE